MADAKTRAIERAAAGECDGSCPEHFGEVLAVHVECASMNWGWFSYCQRAREEDRSNGFLLRFAHEQQEGEG